MREVQLRPTVVMCYRTGCDNKPMWAVKNVPTGRIVKCCDEHLAATLHVSGLPAIVDPYQDEPTGEYRIIK